MSGYQKPGITITEVDTPNAGIVLDRPTVIGLVGLARGNETRNEVVRLKDNDPYTLQGINPVTSPASTFVVRDMARLNTVYRAGATAAENDYYLSLDENTGLTTIQRSLYTTMTSTEKVVVVANTTSPSGTGVYCKSTSGNQYVQLNYEDTSSVMTPTNGGTIAVTGSAPGPTDISVQRAGKYVVDNDYTVNASNGRISRVGTYGPGSGDCHIMSGQTVYVTYTTAGGTAQYVDEPVTLAGTTPSPLAHESEITSGTTAEKAIDIASITVRNCAGMGSSNSLATVFTAGDNGTSGVDFQFTFYKNDGTVNASAAKTLTMIRNTSGPTTMDPINNALDVRIEYKYIPRNYYSPTLFSSFQEVETKYGPAFNSDGTVANPLSAAAYMCFRAGSNEIITQPLYTNGPNGERIRGTESETSHWVTTLQSLQGQDAINVLVPVVGQNSLIDDDKIHAIHSAFVDHINFMDQNNEYVIAIFGEDSTSGNAITTERGSAETLQTHARIFAQESHPERLVLISPAAFRFSNPATGNNNSLIGGQYVAATLAGMLANNPVQASLTRRPVIGISNVGEYRNESEKNDDASAGLLVIENKNNVTRVRHAITTAVGDATKQELNAMRSKFFMIESIQRTLDLNVIGRVLNDGRAPFIVSTQVTSVLDYLKHSGAITGYSGVTAIQSQSSPTAMTVRFTYSLPYAINNIEVVLALDTLTGNVNAQ